MTERSVAIIGKGMIGISLAVLFTGNGIPYHRPGQKQRTSAWRNTAPTTGT